MAINIIWELNWGTVRGIGKTISQDYTQTICYRWKAQICKFQPSTEGFVQLADFPLLNGRITVTWLDTIFSTWWHILVHDIQLGWVMVKGFSVFAQSTVYTMKPTTVSISYTYNTFMAFVASKKDIPYLLCSSIPVPIVNMFGSNMMSSGLNPALLISKSYEREHMETFCSAVVAYKNIKNTYVLTTTPQRLFAMWL